MIAAHREQDKCIKEIVVKLPSTPLFNSVAAAWFRCIFVCFFAVIVAACAASPSQDDRRESVSDADKFESFNRQVFRFNDTVDRWVLKPVAIGYDKVLPSPVKTGVGNFFSNLREIRNIVNDGLQWKWKQAANDTGRLLLNSTVGILGLFDVATEAGLEKSDGENFTQTLAKWGVPRGSYLVLPFWGPTTVRGGFSIPADWYLWPVNYVESSDARLALNALDIVHGRAEILETEELISGDRYLFIREVYLQRLEFLENDGVVEDDFGDDFGDDEYDFDEEL